VSHGGSHPDFVHEMHVGVWSIDRDGVSTYVNRRMTDLLGVPADQIVGRPLLDHFAPEDHPEVLSHMRKRRDRASDHYDVRLVRADGSRLPVRVSGSPIIIDGEFQGSVAAITDLSDLTSTLTERDEALRAAEAASVTKTRFLGWVSHELRTPLNTISGFAQLLEGAIAEPSQRSMASSILAACTHVNGLVQDLLDYSRAEAGMLDPDLASVSMRDVLDQAVALVVGAAREHAVTIEVHCGDEQVVADQRRLVQATLNLLSNAVKYGGRGSTVRVHVDADDQRVRCTITDEGPGMAPELQQRAFRAFERLSNAADADGVGLGLSIADSFVRAMHGAITVVSVVGEGASFTIDLPKAAPASGTVEPVADTTTNSSGLVLYVEDEPLNASLVESIIGLLPGRRLHVEPTVAGGIDAAGRLQPALVLLDLNLPDGSGFDVLSSIRANPATATVPVFILSADATEQATGRARALGADRFITKPFNLKEFVALVEAAT